MTYVPSCPACRDNSEDTFYMSCQGCQARRAKAMQAWHKKPGLPPQPAASMPTPKGGTHEKSPSP